MQITGIVDINGGNMENWRDIILQDFVPNVSRLTLVDDPDSLLSEEKLVLELHNRGFGMIEFTDPVEFRYAYESSYRSIWDKGEDIDLVVILRRQDTVLEDLPYDLLNSARKLHYSLDRLFPNLSSPVVEKLDRSLLDELFDAHRKFASVRLGDNATKDFILRYVFGIVAELIVSDVDLLRSLLRIHFNRVSMPRIFANRLIHVFKENGTFSLWPLDEILPDEEAFFTFIHERWKIFLDGLGNAENRKNSAELKLTYPGPRALPFAHEDVRVYIDNLFVEGKITPVELTGPSIKVASWIQTGIVDPATKTNNEVRVSRLFKLIESEMPTVDSRHSDWTKFALKWAELTCLVHSGTKPDTKVHFLKISEAINEIFARWLDAHYAGLINLSPSNPTMLHHVARRLAREFEDTANTRVALIVVDGLAMDQWITVRKILQEQDPSLVMRESAVFAWIPTMTSVSRQAIFSGKAPLYYHSSIDTTNCEEHYWRTFWEAIGLSRFDIAYQRGLGDGDVTNALEASFDPRQTRVIGLVVDKVDKIMHGMQLGSAGMHNQIKQWCHTGFLESVIQYLLNYGYQVWLTSDHGNIECHGIGRPSEGVIAQTRGERVRVYPTPELRQIVSKRYPMTTAWQPVGLPSDYYPLIAKSRNAFITVNETTVSHGGIAVEEVIVPLVQFERRTR